MHLVELSCQGVRGLSPSVRASLQPGYLVLRAPADGAPLAGLLAEVLYADGRGGDAVYRSPDQPAAAVRLVLVGNDGNTYRLTRALGGAGILERVDAATGQASRISSTASEIVQYLRASARISTRTAFEQLFSFTQAQLPSRAPSEAAPSTAPAATPALAGAQPVQAATDLAAAKAKLAELEKERGLSAEVDRLQFEVDGIASKIFELESSVQGTEGLEASLREAEAAVASAPTPAALGLEEDILGRIERYPALVSKRDEQLAKLETERERVGEPTAESLAVPPLTGDGRFWAGVGIGAACLAAGALVGGMVRYVALLDVPAFGFSALLAIQYVEDLKQVGREKGKGDRLVEREKRIHEQFAKDASPVQQAVKKANVESPQALVELLSQRAPLVARADELRAQLEQARNAPGYREGAAQLAQLRAKQKALEDELLQKGSYIRDVREVEREIGRVSESILLAERPAAAPPVASAAADPEGPSLPDPFPALLAVATDLLNVDIPTLTGQVNARAAQYLGALTDQRWSGFQLDLEGHAQLSGPRGLVPAGRVGASDLDLAHLALKLTLIERVGPQVAMPVVVGDGLAAVDPAKYGLIGRMLKQLGGRVQVLHVTNHPTFVPLAQVQVAI